MSELLDALEDEGVEHETAEFLVEALANAEQSDWEDILSPFVQNPDTVLQILSSVPGAVTRSIAALERRAAAADTAAAKRRLAKERAAAHGKLFATVMDAGLTGFLDVHGMLRCARACQHASASITPPSVWEPRIVPVCTTWGLPIVPSSREDFFSLLCPRWDGVYVSDCGYNHYVRFGSSFDLRQNAQELKANKKYIWVKYRRYLRLLPPDPVDGSFRALVLQHTCPSDVAQHLLSEIDPVTHHNPAKSESNVCLDHKTSASGSKLQIKSSVFAGQYIFLPQTRHVEVRFSSSDGEMDYFVQYQLSHGHSFSSRLDWQGYNATTASRDSLQFDLGRSHWGDGSPADEHKDHFPPMRFCPMPSLEHLL